MMAPFSYSQDSDDDSYNQDFDEIEKARNQTQSMLKDLEAFKASHTDSDGNVDMEAMQKALSENPTAQMKMDEVFAIYQTMKPEKIKSLIEQRSKGTRAEMIYEKAPFLLDFVAQILHHKDVMPNLLRDSKDLQKTKTMGIMMIGTFVFSFILGFILKRIKAGFFTRVWLTLFKFSAVWALRVGILLHFYGDGLRPASKIFYSSVIIPLISKLIA